MAGSGQLTSDPMVVEEESTDMQGQELQNIRLGAVDIGPTDHLQKDSEAMDGDVKECLIHSHHDARPILYSDDVYLAMERDAKECLIHSHWIIDPTLLTKGQVKVKFTLRDSDACPIHVNYTERGQQVEVYFTVDGKQLRRHKRRSSQNPGRDNVWSPSMYADKEKKMYHCYHPCIMETRNKTYTVEGFGRHNRSWISLPPLDYLPNDVDKVIAGGAGLLAMEGGEQPGRGPILLCGKMQIPNAKHWLLEDNKLRGSDQALVCVTNPLTREYILLPPIPGRMMNDKMARFLYSNVERTNYYLVLAGWDNFSADQYTNQNSGSNKKSSGQMLSVVVYSSDKQNYTHANYITDARAISKRHCGRSGMAVVNYGVYFGGIRVITRLGGLEDLRKPALYYFNISRNRKQRLCFDFYLLVVSGVQIEAPKVVQGSPSRVFACTRYREKPRNLWLVEVVLDNEGTPTGIFSEIPNGMMPDLVFQELFNTKTFSTKTYDMSSDDGLIAFKASGKDNKVALYNVAIAQWYMTKFPRSHREKKHYHLFDGAYEPNPLAKP